jgi:hypothetical protein
MDLTLLHRHLCHHHLAGIRKLLLGNLVTGLKLDSKAEPNLVYEACKAGKMHADPFPTSSTRATRPLQLIHSDVHGPVRSPLSQHFSNGVHPIAFFSKSLLSAERNYDMHDWELLAIIYAIKAFRHLLLGAQQKFLIRTDHENLKYFKFL